jgi:hypothetical protein
MLKIVLVSAFVAMIVAQCIQPEFPIRNQVSFFYFLFCDFFIKKKKKDCFKKKIVLFIAHHIKSL